MKAIRGWLANRGAIKEAIRARLQPAAKDSGAEIYERKRSQVSILRRVDAYRLIRSRIES